MSDTILANATLVLPGEVLRGSLRLSGGCIAALDSGRHVPVGALDCDGDLVMPGLVELHTDNLERHLEPRPGVHWPRGNAIMAHDAELCSAGITTVFDALRIGSIASKSNVIHGEYARAVADDILALRGQGALRISHFLHLRAEICSETLMVELARFGPGDGIGILSLMDHTPGQRQFRDLRQLERYYRDENGVDRALLERQIAERLAVSARYATLNERAAVDAARRLGAVLASHDDTTAGHVALSALNGARFAEFPTTIEAARACRDRGIRVMSGAPNLIRGGSHSGNVAAKDLALGGFLDILSSDYVPSSLLSGALHLADLWGSLPRAVATITAHPADAAGLADRGRIAPGARADLIRVARIRDAGAVRGVWVSGQRVG